MIDSATTPRGTTYAGLAADDYGHTDERAPLVLLHGYTFDRTMWRPSMLDLQAFDRDRRAIALDLPGHGGSPDAASYSLRSLVEAVRMAVLDAGLDAPVLVGHSGAAGIAATYAAMFPSRGVVTVDGGFLVAAFAKMLQTMRPALEGAGFDASWGVISKRAFGLDEVTPEVRAFVTETSRPRRDVVLGYWRDLLDRKPDEIQAMVDAAAASARAAGVPFVALAGHDLSEPEAAWLRANLPQARTLVWPQSGHFPHLAHARAFAGLLAETAAWSARDGVRAAAG